MLASAPLLCSLLTALQVAAVTASGYVGPETHVRGIDFASEGCIGAEALSSSGRHPGNWYGCDETAVDPSRQYNGRVYDPGTGFHDYGARMYWPEIGRFISVDPAGIHPENPQSWNRYAYVWNNPYKYTDPTGEDTFRQNRDIGQDEVTSNSDPLSHTFVFTTNPDGSVNHTYSWGNAANSHGWNKDQPEDRKAATDALKRAEEKGNFVKKAKNSLNKVGDSSLDPFVEDAFNEMNKKENEHANWGIARNCKAEASKLQKRAAALREQAAKAQEGAKNKQNQDGGSP